MLSLLLVGVSGCSWSIGLLFTQTLAVGATKRSGFQHGTNENPAGLEIPQCFLSSSPDNRISPQMSPVPSTLINGPLNKVEHPTFIEMFLVLLTVLFWVECSLSFYPQTSFIQQTPVFNQTHKNRAPPRYEEAVKQTRSLQNAAISEVMTFCFLYIYACSNTFWVE